MAAADVVQRAAPATVLSRRFFIRFPSLLPTFLVARSFFSSFPFLFFFFFLAFSCCCAAIPAAFFFVPLFILISNGPPAGGTDPGGYPEPSSRVHRQSVRMRGTRQAGAAFFLAFTVVDDIEESATTRGTDSAFS